MDSRAAELLAGIELDLFGNDIPTSTILQKCILLGGRADSEALRAWASRELNGYESVETLPEYRKTSAVIMMDVVAGNRMFSGVQVTSLQLPEVEGVGRVDETLTFMQGVGELEALAAGESESLKFIKPIAPLVAAEFDRRAGEPFQQVQSIYWSTSRSTIQGIVSRIRTSLTELVAELVAKSPSPQELPPGEVIGQALQLIVNGHSPVINLSAANVSGPGSTVSLEPESGDSQVGDSFSNISNSTIVNRSLVSNSLNALDQAGKTEEAAALRALVEEVEKSGNAEAGEYLDGLNEELAREVPRKTILKSMWDGILVALPYVANIAAITTGIGHLVA